MSEEWQIDYDALLHEAFRESQRGVMRGILMRVAEHNLPGNHHFYISFHTQAPGVSIAPRLLAKYPNEMTIVLQHRFWDLHVQADRFEVKLTFDSIRERLVIPFSSVRMFFDPSVPYGLQFDEPGADPGGFAGVRNAGKGSKAAAERKRTRKTRIESVESDDIGFGADEENAKPVLKTASAGRGDAAKADDQKSAPAKTSEAAAGAGTLPGPTPKTGPRLVDTSANDGGKVVSLDQFRKK